MGPALDLTDEKSKIMNEIVNLFKEYNVSGIGALQDIAIYICFLLAIIEFATDWSLYEGNLRFSKIINDIMKTAFFFFIIWQWPFFVYATENFFVNVGLVAGGIGNSMALEPSDILDQGLAICEDLFEKLSTSMADAAKEGLKDTVRQSKDNLETAMKQNGGIFSEGDMDQAMGTPVDMTIKHVQNVSKHMSPMKILVYLIAIAMILFAHFWIALQLMLTLIEFYIFTALATIFLPFGVCKHTKFLFDNSVQGLVNFGVKMMGLFFLVAIAQKAIGLMEQPNIPADKAFAYYLRVGLTYLSIAFIVWHLPDKLGALMAGSPMLGAGDMLSSPSRAYHSVTTYTSPVTNRVSGAVGLASGAVAGAVGAGVYAHMNNQKFSDVLGKRIAMKALTSLGVTGVAANTGRDMDQYRNLTKGRWAKIRNDFH